MATIAANVPLVTLFPAAPCASQNTCFHRLNCQITFSETQTAQCAPKLWPLTKILPNGSPRTFNQSMNWATTAPTLFTRPRASA